MTPEDRALTAVAFALCGTDSARLWRFLPEARRARLVQPADLPAALKTLESIMQSLAARRYCGPRLAKLFGIDTSTRQIAPTVMTWAIAKAGENG